jgi:hypothetical protein
LSRSPIEWRYFCETTTTAAKKKLKQEQFFKYLENMKTLNDPEKFIPDQSRAIMSKKYFRRKED